MVVEKKVLILGSNAVGKTTMFKNITGELIEVSYRPSLTVNIGYKLFNVNGKQLGLRIWDLGGQLLHRQVWKNYYTNTNGCILIYDITRKTTFQEIQNWKTDMSRHLKKKIPLILVGNKIDLDSEREVNFEDGKDLQSKLKAIAFFETSALQSINIYEVFEKLISSII